MAVTRTKLAALFEQARWQRCWRAFPFPDWKPQSAADHQYCPAVPIGRLRSRIDWAKVVVAYSIAFAFFA